MCCLFPFCRQRAGVTVPAFVSLCRLSGTCQVPEVATNRIQASTPTACRQSAGCGCGCGCCRCCGCSQQGSCGCGSSCAG